MLNLKKVIALVCVFAMMLTTVAFGATYADVPEDSAYYEAVETLTKLGIAEGTGDGFEPEAIVTRAQMAAFIARIQGFGETAKANAATPFTDVPASYWASGYIANAAGRGIINGYGDGTFGPENPVKYEEAVKMIMATLGYEYYAKHNGGYPTGWLAAAQRYDVSLNVANAQVGTDANRGTIAQLLAQAIDTPLMEQVRWSTDGTVDYVICDGQDKANDYTYKTLMSENLGYVKVRGVVMENTVTSINTAKTINTEDEAKVRVVLADTYSTNNKDFKENANGTFGQDSKTEYSFLVAGTDAEDFLGQSVVFYTKKVNDTYEIVSMNVDTVRNDVLVIAPDQFKGYASYEIEYYKEGANDATKIAAGRDTDAVSGLDAAPYVVYNGVGNQTLGTVLGGYVDNLAACKDGGQIRLIDNDSKPGYDVIFVELAGTAVVEDAPSKLISFKEVAAMDSGNVSRIKIDKDDASKIVKIMKDGEEIEASELAEWDVLSIIADGSNANYIVAEVISNPVVGTITGWFESKTSVDLDSPADGKNDGYVIGGNKYDVVDNVYGAADFKVGAGGTFYVNKYGKIAAFVEDKALALGVGANYGYVLGVVSDTSFGKEIKVQMITADGVQVLAIKDNCTIEVVGAENKIKPSEKVSGTYVWGTTADSATNALDAGTYDITGLVQYTKTSEGLINSIKTPGHDAKLPVDKVGVTITAGSYEFDAEAGRFEAAGGNINIDDDAIIFFVDAANVASKCSYGTYANLVDKIPYTIAEVYADDDAASNNIIVARPVSAVSPAASLAVITAAGTAVDEATGDTIYELSYLLDGEEVSAKTIAAADLSSTRYSNVATMPAKGDVVQVEMSADGVITGIKCVAYYASGTLTLAEAEGTKEAYVLATAKAFNKTKKIMTLTESGTDYEFNFNRATTVYVIDATGRNTSIEVGGIGDYTYFKDLYECANPTSHTFTVDGTANQTYAQAVAATDLVLVRFYDDDEAEAIILKSGTEDIVPTLATGC